MQMICFEYSTCGGVCQYKKITISFFYIFFVLLSICAFGFIKDVLNGKIAQKGYLMVSDIS